MATYEIALIIGSIRKDSLNRKLAAAVTKSAPAGFSFREVRIDDLPLYNQDDEADPAASVLRLRSELRSAHGFLFVSPEYNRSIPGVLKNAIDQGSRPKAQNAWELKPAGILGISMGSMGTALAQQHLRNVLSALNVYVLPYPEVYLQAKDGLFDDAGNIGEASAVFIGKWMDRYVDWIRKFAT